MKEENVEEILWAWLKTKGKDIEIFFNRKNIINSPIFHTKGSSKKVDFILSFNNFNKKSYVAIEIKNGDRFKNIADSCKILETYYKNYLNKKTKYIIDKKEIKIDFFIVASQYSQFSKLIKDDNIVVDNINKGNDEWAKMSAQSKTLPRCEYQRTRDFLRKLWASFATFRKDYKLKGKIAPALGILISDITKEFLPIELKIQSGMIGKPMLLTMKFNEKTKKWGQNYSYI